MWGNIILRFDSEHNVCTNETGISMDIYNLLRFM